jgi:hypothetical protein
MYYNTFPFNGGKTYVRVDISSATCTSWACLTPGKCMRFLYSRCFFVTRPSKVCFRSPEQLLSIPLTVNLYLEGEFEGGGRVGDGRRCNHATENNGTMDDRNQTYCLVLSRLVEGILDSAWPVKK